MILANPETDTSPASGSYAVVAAHELAATSGLGTWWTT